MKEQVYGKSGKIWFGILTALLIGFLAFPAGIRSKAAETARLNRRRVELVQGEKIRLRVRSASGKVRWSSRNKRVATVNQRGVVRAKRSGTARIVASVRGQKLTCKVTVRKSPKILVAYFSQTGTTRRAARKIQKLTEGDLFRIRAREQYPDDYDACVERAQEELEQDARPELASQVANMEDYDVILLGYPIWWHRAPMTIYTFLESYDLTGKTVIPFCTSGGSSISESMPALRRIAEEAGAEVGKGLTANSTGTRRLERWLDQNQVTY